MKASVGIVTSGSGFVSTPNWSEHVPLIERAQMTENVVNKQVLIGIQI